MSDSGGSVATQREVAELLGVSTNTVAAWRSKGMPGGRGRYDVPRILDWLRNDGPWSHSPNDDAAADSMRLKRLQADKLEMQILKEAERLIDVVAFGTCINQLAGLIRDFGAELRRARTVRGSDVADRLNALLASSELDELSVPPLNATVCPRCGQDINHE